MNVIVALGKQIRMDIMNKIKKGYLLKFCMFCVLS